MSQAALHIECSICLEFVASDDEKLSNLTGCGHVFHDHCINKWFESSVNMRKPCPQCRRIATKNEVRQIYLQTKPLARQENDQAIKDELEKVRQQLKEEKQRAARAEEESARIIKDSTENDPALAGLVQQAAKLRLRESSTGQRQIFMPSSRHFLFEGCRGLEDSVTFSIYKGPANWQHSNSTCYLPNLEQSGGSLGRDTIHNSLMQKLFTQQIAFIDKTYDQEQDGRLELTVKFGRLYIFGLPGLLPTDQMLVRDFNHRVSIQGNKLKRDEAIMTSYTTTPLSLAALELKLTGLGFKETEMQEFIVLNIDHQKQRPRIQYEVYLDPNLRFYSLRKNDRSFLNIDIRRKDDCNPDIRLAIKAVDEEFDPAKLDAAQALYAKDDLVKWDNSPQRKLMITRDFLGKVTYARHKVMRTFTFRDSSFDHDLKNLLSVKLIENTAFESPQANGTFKYRKPGTEIFIRITGKDKVCEAAKRVGFINDLLAFCDQLQ